MISPGFKCIIHIHNYTGEVEIDQIFDKVTHKRLIYVGRTNKVIFRIRSKNAIPLDKFDKNNQKLGSFCLRDGGGTVCVGHILRYKPYKHQPLPELKKMKKHANPAKVEEHGQI